MLMTPARSGYATVNGVHLFYEDYGDLTAPAMILIMGLGAQLTAWSNLFCRVLLDRGFRVIRFDNRDVGLSSAVDSVVPLKPVQAYFRAKRGLSVCAPYSLLEMADDVTGLLDVLAIERAHIVGASMGGMIAQLVAAHSPTRVASLTSIMSGTNEQYLPSPSWSILFYVAGLTGERIVDVDSAVRNRVKFWQMVAGKDCKSELAVVKQRARESYLRAFRPRGSLHHSLAIMATGGLADTVIRIMAPTLVVHGDQDPFVPLQCGQDSARLIAGARLRIIPGMGHEIPDHVVPKVAGMIADHAIQSHNF